MVSIAELSNISHTSNLHFGQKKPTGKPSSKAGKPPGRRPKNQKVRTQVVERQVVLNRRRPKPEAEAKIEIPKKPYTWAEFKSDASFASGLFATGMITGAIFNVVAPQYAAIASGVATMTTGLNTMYHRAKEKAKKEQAA